VITDSIVRAETISSWLAEAEDQIRQQSDYLTQLDAAIGDGDHGTNMSRGFDAVGKALAGQGHDTLPGPLLIVAGKTLVATVGGASGPLWGSALRRAGRSLGDAESFEGAELADALDAAIAAVVELGAAVPGDKTMVDALVPAAAALHEALDVGRTLEEAVGAAADAARAGAEATVPMRARKGRASYLGGDHPRRAEPRGRHDAGVKDRSGSMTSVSERSLPGTPASPGIAFGPAWRFGRVARRTAEHAASEPLPADRRDAERERALAALAGAAEALLAVAAGLQREDAEIVDTGALMAQDPLLTAGVEEAVIVGGLSAGEAILQATELQAEVIAALPDETLAARADDVRSLGRRAARLADGQDACRPPAEDVILIADELGPADVAELAPWLAGIAMSGGSATAHAAIVARSLGLPMITGLPEALVEVEDGTGIVLDGAAGALVIGPGAQRSARALDDMHARRQAARQAHEVRDLPAVTRDGTRVNVRANVASAEELLVGLAAGAEGIGLLRTELAFLDAADWPSEQAHADALAPILEALDGSGAIVRVLDFGADKAPPFLRNVAQRGLELLLSHPDAFVLQLRAVLRQAQRHDVRILLPMVESADQIRGTRALISQVADALGLSSVPPLGAMIETPAAASAAVAIAAECEFLSIGTNDLTAATLGADRFRTNTARAHHPAVLRSIARSVAAARRAGIPIEVCGEAASDPIMLPLLVGLGLEELSVGAARVGKVREWIRRLSYAETAGLARSALTMDSAAGVEQAARPLLRETGDGGGEGSDRGGGVLARGA
jgi:dihydroxyacetone kinase phosphoprotein-dependent L subunit